jgi:hypothetical protein
MKLPPRFLSLLKATLFASFGAGFGASLAVSTGVGFEAVFINHELTFNCSTLEYCGLTVANTLLAIISWLAGSAGLAIFAAVACYAFALPAVLLSGAVLGWVEHRKAGVKKPLYWLAAGAVMGMLWWWTLWQLQLMPAVLHMHEGEIGPNFGQPPWPLTIAAGFGGITTAWLFRIWWRIETAYLP